MRYLGLDLGSKTLGIAISDKSGTIATALKIINHDSDYKGLIDKVCDIVIEENIDGIVLGYPKNMDNSIGEKGKLSEEFKKDLEEHLDIPIFLEDERLTTKQAEDMLIKNNTSRKKRKKVIDKLAATIILQSYLDRRNTNER